MMTASLQAAYEQGELLRESVYEEGHSLLRWTTWTFAGCVALWLGGTIWAVNASALLFRRLEQQAARADAAAISVSRNAREHCAPFFARAAR